MSDLRRLLFGSCLVAALAAAFPVGCSDSSGGVAGPPGSSPGVDASTDADSGINIGTNQATSVTIEPATTNIEIVNGAIVTQGFKAYAHFANGSQQVIASPSWSSDVPAAGSIDNSGTYTPSGDVGGLVTITATYQGLAGSAKLGIKLRFNQNPANASSTVQTALGSASTPDASCVWAYPYDKTVFPRGLLPAPLEWNCGTASDVYYVHLTSPYFELATYTAAPPPARYAFDAKLWTAFTDSTSGQANLFVSRYDGANATVVTQQTWTIAPESMRGTIYYWANNLGRVMRIQPGASSPDDFANQAPLNDANSYTQSSCLMTCHTVSADGSTLISGGGTYGGSYDLKAGQPIHYLGGTYIDGTSPAQAQSIPWSNSAVSPDGKYVLTNTMAVGLSMAIGGPGGFENLYDTHTGAAVANSGLADALTAMPDWSPTGSLIVYVNAGDPASWYSHWNIPPTGDLHAMDFDATANPMASNDRLLVAMGSDPSQGILWPSISPDGKWVIYGRGSSADSRSGPSDLYIASTKTANSEARLAALDGDNYPFAAGARDLHLNYEPTFAPVASGGFFWVVFTSRRTYGNELLGDSTQVKQLWVAAIDENPTPGKDPSHPPFRLQGQAGDSLNMRGYWALAPCKQDGGSCSSGTDCCDGYCSRGADGGAPVCSKKTGCSQSGDHCDTNADCCSASSGVTCINHVCSEPPPK
jgi:WD40-like Beta Propeller Repeat